MARLTINQLELVQAVQRELQSAGHGRKAVVMERHAALAGVSPATLYQWLKEAGHETGRKRRTDAGVTSMSDEDLKMVSAALLETYRKSGQRIISIEGALELLASNGRLSTQLSASRVSTLLRDRGLHPDQLTRPEPSIEQRSLHPNHVWQVDASVCVAYYLSNAQGLCVMDEKRFYKNKPGNLTRVQEERLIRYAVADHFSHEVLVRYFLGSECAAHLTDFLIWAFAPKPDHVVHGVPMIVQMDMGSANTSAMTLNLLKRMHVKVIVHERHNSRANGAVEKAHHIVETNFESGLRFKHIADLADLNQKALVWSNNFGATRTHTRLKTPRHDAWLRITAEQLRIAPALDVMKGLVTSRPEARRVSNDLELSFKVPGHGQRYFDVRTVPGVMAGAKLMVAVSPYRMPAIDIEHVDQETGETAWVTVEPLEYGADGRRADAQVIGEQMRAAHRGRLDDNRDAVLQAAYGGTADEARAAKEKGALVFGGEVDPFKRAAEAALPAYLPKRGTPMEVGRRTLVAATLNHVEAAKRLKAVLADHYSPQVYAWLATKFPEGVPEDQLDGIAAQFKPAEPNTDHATHPTGLRVVAGGG
jgi:hypothetical protein